MQARTKNLGRIMNFLVSVCSGGCRQVCVWASCVGVRARRSPSKPYIFAIICSKLWISLLYIDYNINNDQNSKGSRECKLKLNTFPWICPSHFL